MIDAAGGEELIVTRHRALAAGTGADGAAAQI